MKIGIPVSESKTQYYINQAYIDYIHEAGMQAFIIMKTHAIDVMIDMLDGLILPGGIDLDPIYYGVDNYTSYGSDPEKDNFERIVFHTFRKANKPIFGICRGFQLIIREYLNVKPELKKSLDFWTNIPGHNQVNDQQLDRSSHQHFVNFLPNLLYNEPVWKESPIINNMPVNSMHHQGLVGNFGKNYTQEFKPIAWTTRGLKLEKGKKETSLLVCEAFQIINWGAPILAVQWHPEELKDIRLLRNFFLKDSNKVTK